MTRKDEELVKAMRKYAENAQNNSEFDPMRDFDEAADALEAAYARMAELEDAQRWTDAEYDTPDIGQAVLLYMPDKETDNIRAGEYMGEGDYRIGNKLYRGMEIDAWLPLPAAPEEGVEK